MTTAPLREALAETLPQRPFVVALWDGSSLPPTNGDHGPTFRIRSPVAFGHGEDSQSAGAGAWKSARQSRGAS